MSSKPNKENAVPGQSPEAAMAPGDEAMPGTPGTGEGLCPECSGSGKVDGRNCGNCLGRGRVIKAISAGP